MKHPRNENHIELARRLRKNMTKEERHLWYDFLRYCKPRFRRQEIIGNYIADFYCQAAKLIVEADGSQHYEPEELRRDHVRTAYFHSLGIRIIRFSNLDINTRFDSVCQAILLAMKECNISVEIDIE